MSCFFRLLFIHLTLGFSSAIAVVSLRRSFSQLTSFPAYIFNKSPSPCTAIDWEFPASSTLIGYTCIFYEWSVHLTNWNEEKAGLVVKRVGEKIIRLKTLREKSQEMT